MIGRHFKTSLTHGSPVKVTYPTKRTICRKTRIKCNYLRCKTIFTLQWTPNKIQPYFCHEESQQQSI